LYGQFGNKLGSVAVSSVYDKWVIHFVGWLFIVRTW
jgi:hypothetical protein